MTTPTQENWASVREIPLDKIQHGRNPRTVVELARSKELAESVRQHGVLMPIRVRPTADGESFIIVAGHRRYEAAKAAKQPTIPAAVALSDDSQAFTQSLVENLQRQDLDPIDEAKAFKALIDETKWTQEELGKQVGRSQSFIANSLRLLTLEPEVQETLSSGVISSSHARALVTLTPERQKEIAKMAVAEKLPSRRLEEIVAQHKQDQRTAEQQEEQLKVRIETAVSTLIAALADEHAEPTITKKTVVVLDEDLVEAVKAAGFKAVEYDYRVHTADPEYECKCPPAVHYEYGRFSPVCITKEHQKAFDTARNAAHKKAAAEATKTTEKTRALIAVKLAEGGALTELGLRVAFYQMLCSRDGDSRGFVKRFGGAPHSDWSSDHGDAWEVVETMTLADLVTEYARLLAMAVQPNVFGEQTSVYGGHGYEQHWKLRQYLAEKKVVTKIAVWGEGGIPQRTLDADKQRLATLAPKDEPKPVKAKKEKPIDLTARAE